MAHCSKCHNPLPDAANYCPACGRKVGVQPAPRRSPRRSKSEGSITRLPGRRKPYWVRLPADYEGAGVTRKSLGCFATKAEAVEALGKAIYAPQAAEPSVITLQDIYDRFINSHYFAALSPSAQATHENAWKHLSTCAHMDVRTINKETFQSPIDELHHKGLKRESLAKVRNLASLLCKEAMGLNLTPQNFGQLVQLPRADSTPAPSFSIEELKSLWALADSGDADAQAVLVLCYTGMRPSELLNARIEQHLFMQAPYWYFQTGSKTKAGRNRYIPIPAIIRPFIVHLCGDRLEGPLIPSPTGKHYSLTNWRHRCFIPCMASLGIEGHTPYSCRHTYADINKRRRIAPDIMTAVLGHEDYATTVERYHSITEDDITYLCKSMNDIERPE